MVVMSDTLCLHLAKIVKLSLHVRLRLKIGVVVMVRKTAVFHTITTTPIFNLNLMCKESFTPGQCSTKFPPCCMGPTLSLSTHIVVQRKNTCSSFQLIKYVSCSVQSIHQLSFPKIFQQYNIKNVTTMPPNSDQRSVQNVSKFLDTFWRYFLEMTDV